MTIHIPVLAGELIELLDPQPGQIVVDGTLGGGGHTILLAEKIGPTGRVIALDRDPQAVLAAKSRLPQNVQPIHANYGDLPAVLTNLGIETVDSILLDLGLSSDQLADSGRGFSFRIGGPLDLRFDPTHGEPASALVNRLSERDLADLIFEFGEERKSRIIARRICTARREKPIRTAEQLADLIRSTISRSRGHSIDPATRTFQALRIAVNEELRWLQVALDEFPALLKTGGRFAVISFHSLEDRLVKNAFRANPAMSPITKKPVCAGEAEMAANPRSRSAKLRVAIKVGA